MELGSPVEGLSVAWFIITVCQYSRKNNLHSLWKGPSTLQAYFGRPERPAIVVAIRDSFVGRIFSWSPWLTYSTCPQCPPDALYRDRLYIFNFKLQKYMKALPVEIHGTGTAATHAGTIRNSFHMGLSQSVPLAFARASAMPTRIELGGTSASRIRIFSMWRTKFGESRPSARCQDWNILKSWVEALALVYCKNWS